MAESYKNSPAVGILLANLGTPTAPKRRPVAKFLREFLSDPRVVDLPRYLWLPLLNLVIIPLRASRSAAAYRKIWWPEGSPLLILTRRLAERLGRDLTGNASVEIGMRYVANGDPYEDQCRKSVRAIANAMGLEESEWLLTYQSRVGREPWLQPYTDMTLKSLAESGVRHVQVACPGFAVDCLETLEEIAMQNAELFQESGGEKLEYIPALNDSESHVRVMREIVGV